jgi:Flp pilus assembly pilin Flp
MKHPVRDKSGQSMVEYIIIVVVVAIAALAIFGVFSDTIRSKLGGAVNELGADQSKVDDALSKSSVDTIKDIDADVGGDS